MKEIKEKILSKAEWNEHSLGLLGQTIVGLEEYNDKMREIHFSNGKSHEVACKEAKAYCEQQLSNWIDELLK